MSTMKPFPKTAGLLLAAAFALSTFPAGSAEAAELRFGFHNVQTTDGIFAPYHTADDDFWDVGSVRTFNLLDVQVSGHLYGKAEYVGGLRFGSEDAELEGLTSTLTIVDPYFGLRRTQRFLPSLSGYAQVAAEFPWLRSSLTGYGAEDHVENSFFPQLSGTLGLAWAPWAGPFAITLEGGYASPAPFDVGTHGGFRYGGLTYGLFFSVYTDASRWAGVRRTTDAAGRDLERALSSVDGEPQKKPKKKKKAAE